MMGHVLKYVAAIFLVLIVLQNVNTEEAGEHGHSNEGEHKENERGAEHERSGHDKEEENIYGINGNLSIEEFKEEEFQIFCSLQASSKKFTHNSSQCTRILKTEFHPDDMKIVFKIFFVICYGSFIRTLLNVYKLNFPFTVIMMISGLIEGVVAKNFCEHWYTYTAFARTAPEIILYTFLPVLIFETAFGIHAHTFMRAINQILLTAFPGMLIATFLTAFVTSEFFPSYNWTFIEGCFFGSIISATDPVAVVAILKELGASEKLSVLIDGESLLNDGVAILLYEIFKEQVEYEKKNVDQNVPELIGIVSRKFIQIAICGPLFGWVMARISIFCLARVFNDAIVEITITLVGAYMTYWLSEHILGVSGVMAVVALGLTLSNEKTCISPDIEEEVHEFWGTMCNFANSVLFYITGIVIGERSLTEFEWDDLWYLILLYFSLNLIRFIMLLALAPILAKLGYGITWQNLMVMMWGGLRGAVGVCLALQVFEDVEFCSDKKLGPKILFQSAGIVFLTLVVNGTTTKFLLDTLKLTAIPQGKLEEMEGGMKEVWASQEKCITMLKHDPLLKEANWDMVKDLTTLVNPYADIVLTRTLETKKTTSLISTTGGKKGGQKLMNVLSCPDCHIHMEQELDPNEYAVITEEARLRVLKAMKVSYWSQYEAGVLTEVAVQILSGVTDLVEDKTLYMLHMKDLKKYWNVTGVVPWLRKKLLKRLAPDPIPSKPTASWRRPFWYAATNFWFEHVMTVVVILNMIPVIWEFVLETQAHSSTDEKCTGAAANRRETFKIVNCVFTTIYICEFFLKVVGRGAIDYFSSKWNYIDFVVLMMSLIDVGVSFLPCDTNTGKILPVILKVIRIIRLARLLRLIKPLLPLILNALTGVINSRLFLGYDVATGFVMAIDDVTKYLPHMVENSRILEHFKHHLEKERIETVREMGMVQKDHPGIAIAVKTRHSARAVLNQMRSQLFEMKQDGLIDDKENALLVIVIEERMKRLWNTPSYIPPITPEKLLTSLNWMIGNSDLQEYILANATMLEFDQGDKILTIGDEANGINLIVSGVVKVRYEPTNDIAEAHEKYGLVPNSEIMTDMTFSKSTEAYLTIGSAFGESATLTGRKRSASVTCETAVTVYQVPLVAMREALKTFRDDLDTLEARMWRSCGLRRGLALLLKSPIYEGWSPERLRIHLEKSVAPIGEEFNEAIKIPGYVSDVILIEGLAQDGDTGELYIAPCLLPRVCTKFILMKNPMTVNRFLLVTYDNVDPTKLPKKKVDPVTDRLLACMVKGVRLRQEIEDAAAFEEQANAQQRRYSVAVNFGVNQAKRKLEYTKAREEDADLRKKWESHQKAKVTEPDVIEEEPAEEPPPYLDKDIDEL